MANIAYIRLQQDESEKEAKKSFEGMSIGKYFIDSEKDRSNRDQMIDYVRDTDTVIIRSLTDFAGSLTELFSLLEALQKKGTGFRSINEPVIDSATGCSLYDVIGTLSSFKKEALHIRQNEGRQIAKSDDRRYRGRERKPINMNLFISLYNKWRNKEVTKEEMCRKLNISLATLDRRIAEHRKKRR